MKNVLVALILGLYGVSYSQADIDYSLVYDSNVFLTEGIRLYDEGKYKDAIDQFDKIVKNDPKFYVAQYEKSLAIAAGKDTEITKAFFEDAFSKGYMDEEADFYMAYANFLSDQKEYEKSEKMFLEAQKLFPNSSVLLYNLALLYVRKDERQKSIDILEKAISINPNHAGSHYLLGLIAIEDGHVTEGTMALLAYLTLVPESTINEEIILKLNAKFSDNYLDKSKYIFSKTGGDNFEEIDIILRNSLPLKSAYKVKSTIDDVIIRQVQAIAEYAVEHKMENGFFETTYIPWLADIVKKDQFEGFSYYILLGMKEKLGKKITSQNKKIKAFSENYIDNGFWEVFAKRNVDLFGKQEEVVVYLQNRRPYILGKVVNGKKEGKYKILNESGNVKSELNFLNDQLEGLQKYYDNKGRLIEEKSFVNGKLDGKRTTYYENGNIDLVENYKNDLLEGISSTYYINGGKNCEINFLNGERNGTLICLYENGTKKSVIDYSNGKLNGKYTLYDEAGNIYNELSYNMDKLNGKATEYYDGKTIKSEIVYNMDIPASSYKSYFSNSTIKEESTYENGNIKNSIYNFANGQKSHEILYDKDGYTAIYYNSDGNKYYQQSFNRGEIKSALQFESGKPKPTEIPVNKGIYTVKDFDGTTITKGKYEKGKKKGEWNYFYNTDILRSKENYENGLLDGIVYNYNSDSRLSSTTNYSKDTINGVYYNYTYGRIESIYHYKNGSLYGPDKSFYPDGSVSGESFYVDGKLSSKSYSYWQNGNISYIIKYENGNPLSMETYTVEGKKENEIDYKNKNGKVVIPYYNGNENHEFYMTNGVLNGNYTVKDKTGKLITEGNYANGVRNGKYTKYGPTGAINTEINFYAGKTDGISKYYDLVGTHRMSDTYVFGSNTGTETRYFNNKGKFIELTQFDDNIEGESKYYNQKGDNILILGYQNNKLVYYIKLDKEGKLTEKTPIVSQTAKIVSIYPNGKNAIEINFMKGNLDGKFAISSFEGKPEYEANYNMAYLTGSRIEYYSNGKIYKKENFKDSNFEGLQEFFKEDGKPWLTAEYKNDQMHGLCKIYTNGILTQTKRYDSDELVEILK